MPQFTVTIPARDWEARTLASIIGDSSIVSTHASTSPRWRDAASEDLQTEMETQHHWPEGTLDRRAGDGPSTLTITFLADVVPDGVRQAAMQGTLDIDD